MRWSLRRLEIIRLLAQTMSVTETARMLSITQPAVSQALKEVELVTGVKFFRRQGNRLRITQEAQGILPSIERVFEEIQRLDARAAEIRDSSIGSIAIASMAPLSSGLVSATMSEFLTKRPGIRFSVESLSSTEILQRVRQERADLGLTLQMSEDLGVMLEPLLTSEIVAVMRRAHPLARRDVLTIPDLRDQIVVAHSERTPLGTILRDTVGRLEPQVRSLVDVNQSSTAIELARQGNLIALTHPFNNTLLTDPGLSVVRLSPSIRLVVTLVLSRARPVSRLMSNFIADLRAHARLTQAAFEARGLPMIIG